MPKLLASDAFLPMHVESELHLESEPSANGSTVVLSLYAGVEPTEDRDEDSTDAERFRTQSRAGWYLFCNDRLLLAADKTALTGWGSAAAAYHPQYRLFRGYAFLRSEDSSLLPWNTTKTGVDEDSQVFRSVQREMFAALRMGQAVLNRLKDERQTREAEDRPLLAALSAAAATELKDLPDSDRFVLPPAPRRRRAPTDVKSIQYAVGLSEFQRVAAELGTTSGSEVGRQTFQHFLRTQAPEE